MLTVYSIHKVTINCRNSAIAPELDRGFKFPGPKDFKVKVCKNKFVSLKTKEEEDGYRSLSGLLWGMFNVILSKNET